jgi:3-phenylpropionate/trans-cinnamate dioxygenase ferredoxin component
MPIFVTVAKTTDIEPGQVKYVAVDDYQLAICNVDGTFHCIENVCTHDGGALNQGYLQGDVIECPRHGGRFNVISGKAVHMPAVAPVEVFPVKVEGDEVKVSLD